ncbi:MAG: DNA polymerase I [Candidatus Nanopelagicales bacterium]
MSTKTAPPKLLLVDGNSLAYRAFYALPVESFTTSAGQSTNAVYGFCTMFLNALNNESPTHLAVAFDVSRQTFRSERYPLYKANRAKSPEEFVSQLGLIEKFLDSFKVKSVKKEGFEADDLIATLAKKGAEAGFEVLILTGDRDSYQLASDKITVLYALKGVSEIARMTPKAIEDKYGLTPAQYPDFAALRGDASDNLPSVPGVGEKTALKWISEYKDLENLLANAQNISGKVGESLRENLEQVRLNRELTQLITDVAIDTELANYALAEPESNEVLQVFTELEFNSLKNRFKSLFLKETKATQDVKFEILTKENAIKWLKSTKGENVSFLVNFQDGKPQTMAIAGAKPKIIELDPVLDEFIGWCENSQLKKQIHNLKPLTKWLISKNSKLAGLQIDTHLAGYLLNPGSRNLDLEELSLEYLNLNLASSIQAPAELFEDLALNQSQLVSKAIAVEKLSTVLIEKIAEVENIKLLTELELPLAMLLCEMEHYGVAMDLPYLKKLESEFDKEASSATLAAHKLAGREFNLASPKQLQEILFQERNLPKTKKTKTGYTTDADALNWLFENTQDPLLEQILTFREFIKLKQIVSGLIPLLDSHSRIHTTLNQTVTATGRLSSQDPNLQNIPIRTEHGKKIRKAFIAGKVWETLVTADYSQIEMRIMAHLSDDENLIAAFNSGEDLHTTVGALVFGVKPNEVDEDLRRQVKAVSYGIAYGLSSYGLSQTLGIGVSEASELMETYYKRFGKVRDYLAEVVKDAKKNGYTQTLLGRRRYLPDLNSQNRQLQQMAERMALNAPIQGSAADLIKLAMLRVKADFEKGQLRSRLILQVHDELIIEVAPGEREIVEKILPAAMGGAYNLKVPLAVSVGQGNSWAEAAH